MALGLAAGIAGARGRGLRTPAVDLPAELLPGLRLALLLEESAGADAVDRSGYGHHLPAFNAPGAGTGKVGGARTFTRTGSLAASQAFRGYVPHLCRPRDSFWVAVWIKPASYSGDGSGFSNRILCVGPQPTTDTAWSLHVKANPIGAVRFKVHFGSGISDAVTAEDTSFGQPPLDEWTLLQGWWDRSAGSVNLKINARATVTQTGCAVVQQPGVPLAVSGRSLQDSDLDNGAENWDGLIDNVLSWHGRVPDASALAAVWNSGAGVGAAL